MPSFEQVCAKFFPDAGFPKKLLIGGLLSFIPILNFLALGYLYRYSLQVREKGLITLPEWEDWQGLFLDGVIFFIIILIFGGAPAIAIGTLAFISAALADFLHVPLLGDTILLLPLTVTLFLLCPLLTMSALYRFQTQRDINDLLPVDAFLKHVFAGIERKIIPTLAFAGLMLVGWPIYGFPFFLGFAAVIAYFNILFIHLEKDDNII